MNQRLGSARRPIRFFHFSVGNRTHAPDALSLYDSQFNIAAADRFKRHMIAINQQLDGTTTRPFVRRRVVRLIYRVHAHNKPIFHVHGNGVRYLILCYGRVRNPVERACYQPICAPRRCARAAKVFAPPQQRTCIETRLQENPTDGFWSMISLPLDDAWST